MKRMLMLVALVALSLGGGAVASRAADDGPVAHFAQEATLGYYRGSLVEYLDFGPVKLAKGNKVAPIWAFDNGAAAQRNIIDTVPGQRSYTPLWDVVLVTWKAGETARVLKSAAAVRRAAAAGEVTLRKAGIVVNCPVI
ncbi:MAG TPA: hypothetical protein VNP93_13845 [Gaiellaceae bacterium]|nr:hypothetical protein [Gaiellaceae bacterium]